MKHHAIAAAMGLLTALLIPGSHSLAAGPDPTGIWMKQEASDYPAKMDIRKCGKGQLCSKIVWLQVLNDSKGKPLHDVRNEDPSMRDRPILGLPIFNNLTPSEPGVWVGDIYNPEDGHFYSDIKLTVVSRNQVVIRGCKAWLLCGEKIWTRSTLPAPPAAAPAEPEQQEVKAPEQQEVKAPQQQQQDNAPQPQEIKTPAAPDAKAPVVEAAVDPDPIPPTPTPKPHRAMAAAAPAAPQAEVKSAAVEPEATQALPKMRALAPAPQVLKPELPAPSQDASAGYGFMLTTASPETAPPFSSERVSSMFVITHPLGRMAAPASGVTEAAVDPQDDPASAPLPDQKPRVTKVKPHPAVSADAGDSTSVAAAAPKPKPKPPVKKPQEDLPWLQHP
jgi:uncharacterized protein (DUF2147 family)